MTNEFKNPAQDRLHNYEIFKLIFHFGQYFKASVYAEKPQKDIHSFIGKMSVLDADTTEESLGVENTIWCGAVVASGVATGTV